MHGRIVKAALKRAGLSADWSPHDLRHHFASVLIGNGVDIFTVANWLGHSNAILVQTCYGHMLPSGEDRTRRVLDGAWQGQRDDSSPAGAGV